MAKAKMQQTIDELTSLDALPDRSADEGLTTLRSRRSALEARLTDVNQQLHDIQRQLLESQRTSAVEFLAESFLQDPGAAPLAQHSLREELGTLDQTLNGLRRAIERTDIELLDYESSLDGAACRAVAAQNRKNVRSTINVMLGLRRSIIAQQNLHHELNARGVQRTSQLVGLVHEHFLTGVEDIHSYLAGALRDLTGFGILSEVERLGLQRGELLELDLTELGS